MNGTETFQLVSRISQAIDLAPDLIISAGNDLVDPLALVTPNHLDQQFLVVGGEGLGMSSAYDPASFAPERAAAAVRAGVASVLNGLTGIVIWVG